jgi:hypothetical protein
VQQRIGPAYAMLPIEKEVPVREDTAFELPL